MQTYALLSPMRRIVYTAMCMAMCVVLPLAFHAIPDGGSIFSPMHLPVLLCGLICGPVGGTACGIVGPLLSSVLFQMPPMAYLAPMMVECAVYGLATGVLMRFVRTGRLYGDLYTSLTAAMLLGRCVAGAARALFFSGGTYSFPLWATAYFVTSLPGIVIQLVLLPTLILALQKAKLIPRRYPKKCSSDA